MREAIFLSLIVFAGTGGELCISRTMKQIGELSEFHPAALLQFLFRAVRAAWFWAGIGLLTVAFASLLAMLSIQDVTFVVPVTALSYAAGAVGAKLFLREHINRARWLGIAIVCLGVTIVWFSKH